MKKYIIYLVVSLIVFLSILNTETKSCTIVVKANNEIILVGNNEDYVDPRTKIYFFEASPESFGRVYWGFDRFLYPYQGGMNDQGLFVDINSIGSSGWKADPAKPNLQKDPIEQILESCGNVDEVVDLFQKYNIDLGWAKFVCADAMGKSAIFEFLDGELNVMHRKGDYQISTNYLSPKEHTEPRYQISEKILQSQNQPTIGLIRKTLAATAYDVGSIGQTLYSTICDLKNKKLYLYNFHYFEEVVEFDLTDELQKGDTEYKIPTLFETRSHFEYWYNHQGMQLGARDLDKIISDSGIEEGIKKFKEISDSETTFPKYYLPEWMFRSMGLRYLSENKLNEAVGLFKLNIELNPESKETYFDLANAYLKNEDEKSAIQILNGILRDDHDNPKALEMLKTLRN